MTDPEEIKETADEILSRPEYQPSPRSVLDRAFSWVNEQFADLLGGLFGRAGSFAIGWFVLAVGLLLIAWLLWKVMPHRRFAPDVTDARLEHEVRARASRAAWLAQADEAEAAGNWVEAVRALYRATVAGLLDQDEVDDQEGATSGDYRRSFQGSADRQQPFGTVTEVFENTWYGGQTATDNEAKLLQELDPGVVEGPR